MAGNLFPRGALTEGLQMCAETGKSAWSQACSFLPSQAAGDLLLTGCCHLLNFFILAWLWWQSVKVFSRIQTRRSVTKRARSDSSTWKDQIAMLEAAEKGPALAMNGEHVDPQLIPVVVIVSDCNVKQKVLKTSEFGEAIDVNLERGSSLVQSKLALNSESLSMLHKLAIDGTKKDSKFMAQLSRWRLWIRTPDGAKMLQLDDSHEVPTILHAAYAAGKLTIEGFNLEGAEIKASTFDKCITVKDLAKEEVGGVQIWTSVTRLPSNNLGEVFVYAAKSMCIDDHKVTLHSSVFRVQDQNLRIVLRVGIPSTIGLIYVIKTYLRLSSLEGWRFADPAIVWILPLIAMAVTQILPQSTEDAIELCIDRIGLATASLYIAARNLLFKEDPERFFHPIDPLPQAPNLQRAVCEEQGESTEDMKIMKKKMRPPPPRSKGRSAKSDKPARELSGDTEDEPQCFVYEEYLDGCETLIRKRDSRKADAKRSLPFKFVHGLKNKLWVQRDYFKFYAGTVLIEVLQKLLPENFNLMGSNKKHVYAGELFPFRHELKQALDTIAADLSINLGQAEADQARAHLQYFWEFFDASCREVSDRYEAMKKEGSVSWDMLWAFFSSDTKVAYRCAVTGEELCATARSTHYNFGSPARPPRFIIGLKTWDYNCRTWESYSSVKRQIDQYPGLRDFASLETHPLEFKSNPQEAENRFLAKGRWFGELSMLADHRFMHYEGLMYRATRDDITRDAMSGRVMIALASFAKMNPDYPMNTATPPNDHRRTNQVEPIDISEREDRMFAPAIVYGFSFQLKKWGAFAIDGFEEIVFNESAYESLVMDPKVKDTVYSLVHKYKHVDDDSRRDDTRERVDPIVGKGVGCILLCYGPPGTGKTYTAESISEKLHAPLWSLSVSELGTTPEVLEERLVKILDVAASWGAVLLLDEADVYLEKRNTGTMDLERNAMTGIFLRNLEYYKGVLFLTTNRVVAFDDAFCSRISMFLYYEKHSEGDRKTIWRNLLTPLKVKDLEAFLETDYASIELNAREIRNVVQVARTLAKTKGVDLSGVFLSQSLETLAASLLQLRRVTREAPMSSFA